MRTSARLILFLGLLALSYSCGSQYGRIVVTTSPVPGKVMIDGVSYGTVPLDTMLVAGDHVVSFLPYSPQYPAPDEQEVAVHHGTTTVVTGAYVNRFIPSEPPVGFTPADSLRLYGTAERKLKDGTIFDYINGGGLAYLKHGLRETTHLVLQNGEGCTITLDIFDMGTVENAHAAFDDEVLCPPEFSPAGSVVTGKAYHYPPDYFLYFTKNRYLVYLNTDNDVLRTILEEFASEIQHNIPEEVQS